MIDFDFGNLKFTCKSILCTSGKVPVAKSEAYESLLVLREYDIGPVDVQREPKDKPVRDIL